MTAAADLARAGGRCRICGAAVTETHAVREMMFGTREVFGYERCGDCGCLQIAAIPSDLARHYGTAYYSFGTAGAADSNGASVVPTTAPLRDEAARGRSAPRRFSDALGAALVRARNRHLAGRADPLGRAMARLRPYAALAALRPLGLGADARIVDVGCGGGELLRALHGIGFSRLLGVDPFIAADHEVAPGLALRKAELAAVDGVHDVVMFHHSLEHMPDQRAVLAAARARLAPDGVCIVRVPTVASHAWRHYGVDWCQLDAPRHLVLHSPDSIGRLAGQAGLRVDQVVHDSNGFQFWGSEQYRRDVALMPPGARSIAPAAGLFSPAQLRGFERRARALNQRGDGDQMVVYLRPVP